MENNKEYIGRIINIKALYKLKKDTKFAIKNMSPEEYFFDPTEDDVEDEYNSCIQKYSDLRDYMIDIPKDKIELLIIIIKRYRSYSKEITISYYFDDKSLTLYRSCPINNTDDVKILYTMDSEDCNETLWLYGAPVHSTRDNTDKILLAHTLSTNNDEEDIIHNIALLPNNEAKQLSSKYFTGADN